MDASFFGDYPDTRTYNAILTYLGTIKRDPRSKDELVRILDEGLANHSIERTRGIGRLTLVRIRIWADENRSPERSLRDDFAMAAMQGLLAKYGTQFEGGVDLCSYLAYAQADAMLKARIA